MDGNKFLLEFKCGEIRSVTFSEMRLKWPDLLITFCQKCLVWCSGEANIDDSNVIEESMNAVIDFNEIICEYFAELIAI